MKAFGNYINGEFVDSKSGRTFPNINPANIDEVVGNFQASNEADVEDACSAAVAAQEEWAATPATKRGEYLFKAADLLTEKLAQLGEEMTREEGKTLPGGHRRSHPRDQYLSLLRRRRRHGNSLTTSLQNVHKYSATRSENRSAQ